MEILYVTSFEVDPSPDVTTEPANVATDPADVCLEMLGTWIGGVTDPVVAPSLLRSDGSRELALAHGQVRRSAKWEHVEGDGHWATRVERRDEAADHSEFITRITVGGSGAHTTVRVSMAREVATAGLTPVAAPELRQPVFVETLARDLRLNVRVDGQIQDGRYLPVRSPDEVEVLAKALDDTKRLPILLLHTRTLEAQAAAHDAAARLIGLVRVVTLDFKAARNLRLLRPHLDVPYAGGLLVWADSAAPASVITDDLLNQPDRSLLRQALMVKIAPLSVLTSGADRAYRTAKQAQQRVLAREAAALSAQAVLSGSYEQQIEALGHERDRAIVDERSTFHAWEEAQELAEKRGEEIARLKAQVEQLTVALRFHPDPNDTLAAEPTLENAPDLFTGDETSFTALAEHLEKAVSGRIAFTEKASSAWKKADRYSTPDEMQRALVKLASIARDLYDGSNRSMGHVDTWIRENYDLRVALQDDEMPAGFRHFVWDGRDYDRTPHVKVNDGVPSYNCGRIYFAFDKENAQLVVDHVGIHW